MLLSALHEFAQEHALFDNVHLQERDLHLLIPINMDGELTQAELLPLYSPDAAGREVLGQKKFLPRFPGENNGGKAYFLAESCLAILGVDKKNGESISFPPQRQKNPAKTFAHFWDRVNIAHDATNLPELLALLRFKERYLYIEDEILKHRLPFIEVRISPRRGEPEVGAKVTSGSWERLAQLTLSFQVDGYPVFDGRNHDNPLVAYWRQIYTKEAFSEDEIENGASSVQTGTCLVSGATDIAIARSHKPKILGIPGVSSGGYIVSFAKECPAFSSYGFEMGENAPVSEETAASYALALQALIDNENTSLKIGPLRVCFWAKKSNAINNSFAQLLRKPDPLQVAAFLRSPWAVIDRHAAKLEQFYSVTLCGNAGRIAVRHWMQSTVEEARVNFAQWFRDLEITDIPLPPVKKKGRGKRGGDKDTVVDQDADKMPPFALFRLACATVREAKDLRPEVPAQLYQAALEGTAPSIMLIKPILHRLEADLQRYGMKTLFNLSRFALLKLILNRNSKEGDPMIEAKVFETEDKAYNCGRLLAVLAETQAKAHDYKLEGAGVAERYFGTASVSPASVFPLLLRLNRHHLDKIRKSNKYGGHARFIEESMQAILVLLKPDAQGAAPEFPRHLSLQEQGRFAIGFYQQKAENEQQKQAARAENQGAAHDDQG
ncbi:type I-C CRISPR-associated protein Cas8c/Csd1 [Desulfurivibrio sp. D14AmB]|uniref:type I-C CRISPR-associated protein Cas8c/Csd1 n=1 Tax=Desulfurivibrio sp. D14AmB TaxID=3374370 RepID=UPI00376EC0B0